MIRLSRLADYAILIMAEYAKWDENLLLNASRIADATRIPHATVSKLLKLLTKAGLLISLQGNKGGYSLARPKDEITVAGIIQAVDGPVSLTVCSVEEHECELEKLCAVSFGLRRINSIIQQELEKVTLAELVHPYHLQAAKTTREHV